MPPFPPWMYLMTKWSSTRQELLPDSDTSLIVAVGNLLPCKGHQTLIEAAAVLKSRGRRCKTIIVGEGEMRSALEAKISQLRVCDEVKLLGFRNDADDLLAAADVVAHPSHNEGLCLTVAAAMLHARPVAATAVGGLRDVLGIDGRMGASGPLASTFEPGRSDQLADVLQRLLNEPPSEFSLQRAKRFATKHFTQDRLAAAMLQFYDGMMLPHRVAA